MNVQVLIDSLVQQVTVLIAQLATSGGVRAPVAHVANQVFLELARELEVQGVSRKVSADMFGMALRAYQRKLRRLTAEGHGREPTLWKAVLDEIATAGSRTRAELLAHASGEDEALVRGVLRDLLESGLLECTGQGDDARYRLLSEDELQTNAGSTTGTPAQTGLDELLWALVYRGGPVQLDALAARLPLSREELASRLDALVASGGLQRTAAGYVAHDFSVPLRAEAGWEAAVFDHVQAVVRTICQRLRLDPSVPQGKERVGGSTYTFDIWDGHPLAAEVEAALAHFRAQHGELRERVEAYAREHGRPSRYRQVVLYGGQSVTEREAADSLRDQGEDDADA